MLVFDHCMDRYAATGAPVDVSRALPDMTMDAIGMAAFGLDLDCFGIANGKDTVVLNVVPYDGPWYEAPIGSIDFSRGLVSSARRIFSFIDLRRSSPWRKVVSRCTQSRENHRAGLRFICPGSQVSSFG